MPLPALRSLLAGHWSRNALAVSVLAHLLFFGFAAAFVAIRVIHRPQSTLVAEAPPRPALELRQLEMRVKVADLQKTSARPRLRPRMVASRPTDIALPELQPPPAAAPRKLERDYAAVGVEGFGTGIGGGFGTGTGGGSGEISFFGLKGSGDKVCLVVDVSLSMCEDQRGGLPGFQSVKHDVGQVIRALPDGTLFNVIAFQDQVARCWEQMRPAGRASRREAEEWIDQFNRMEGPYGVTRGNYSPGAYGLAAAGGSSRLDLALSAAFEQGADSIFVITDGVPQIRRPATGEPAYREYYDPGHTVTDDEIRAWEKAMEQWQEDQARRQRKGEGPRLSESGRGRPPPRPQNRPAGQRRVRVNADGGWWSPDDILAHISTLQHALYADQGRREARVHAVGYEVDGDTRRFLRELARDNHGTYRSISGR